MIDTDDEKDPSIIPDDIKEFVKKAHKAQRESRPDETWRITPPEKGEPVAPYKRDEEDLGDEKDSEMLHMAHGGVVPGYFDGGPDLPDAPPDMNSILQQLAPQGSGLIAPSPSAPDPVSVLPPPQAPDAPPTPPAAPIAASADEAPIVPHGTIPAETEQTFTDRANKMLGLNPDEQSSFIKMVNQNGNKGLIGAGIAGIGDAIASGGTLGKVNPGGMNRALDNIEAQKKGAIENMQTLRGNNEKTSDLAQKLQSQDPNSPLSKYAQKAYGAIGKKLGIDLSHASASLIGDVSGKGVDALNTEYQNQLKTMGLSLQKAQIDATIQNQKAERDIQKEGRQTDAAKALGTRTIGNKIEGMIPGTSANTERTALEKEAGGDGSSTGPFGPETMRNGKAYEWSSETGKYHLKQ